MELLFGFSCFRKRLFEILPAHFHPVRHSDAGFFAEAFDEFENCLERRGEATAMFLDDSPTFRYLAELPYWTARAQDGLGMRTDAIRNYQSFLALRPEGGPLADDARQRLQ